VSRIREILAGLSPLGRWGVLCGSGVILALLLGAGVRAYWQQREAAAAQGFAEAAAVYQTAATEATPESQGRAADRLKEFVKAYPRSAVSAQAWYMLGNAEYRRGANDAALAAFDEASRLGRGSLAALSRVGTGYAAEAKGDLPKALEAYQGVLRERDPKDFLYGEVLLAVARVQEQMKQPAQAIESYRKYLKGSPPAARAEEAKIRLALLGASPE
jgi:tetratricopeptide (TPR) repeat protein